MRPLGDITIWLARRGPDRVGLALALFGLAAMAVAVLVLFLD
jgi:hypothetical protein